MNRRFAVVLAALSAACSTGVFVACGGDDSGSSADSGPDVTPYDATAPDNVSPTPDSGTKDSGMKDSTVVDSPHDGGTDSAAHETGSDGPGSDVNEGGGGSCTLFDASALSDASVYAGFLEVWQVYRCYACHQAAADKVDDAGAGILLNGRPLGLGDSGTIFPPNLTNSVQGLGCWTDQEIITAMLTGKDPEGGTLCPPMAKYGTASDAGAGRPMDAGTAQEIVDYIRSLTPSAQTVPDTTCSSPPADAGSDSPVDGQADSSPDAAADAPADSPADTATDATDASPDAPEDSPTDAPDAG
jgi:hypothetical protein